MKSCTEVQLRVISPVMPMGLENPVTRCCSIGAPGLSILRIVTRLFSTMWNIWEEAIVTDFFYMLYRFKYQLARSLHWLSA